MHYKRTKPRQYRAGCMMCKGHKATFRVGAERRAKVRIAFEIESAASDGGRVRDHRNGVE